MPTKQINAENGTEPDKRNTVDGADLSDNGAFFLLDGGEIGAEPPTEFRVLKGGKNRARKGGRDFTVVFDAKARKALAENIRPNRQLPFDTGHRQLSNAGPATDDEAVGWFQPEIRGRELWATEVEFVDDFAEKIRERRFRFFSPAFDQFEMDEGDDGLIIRPLGITNIALTNIPALRDIEPLVADESPLPVAHTRIEEGLITIGLERFRELSDARASIPALREKIEALESISALTLRRDELLRRQGSHK